MGDFLLVDLPGQVDLAAVAEGGEVDEAGFEVADQQVQLLEVLEAQRRSHSGIRAFAPRIRAADHVGERREARVESLVLERALRLLEAANGDAHLGKEGVGLIGCVVALVKH